MTLTTMEAEHVSLDEACRNALWLRNIFIEIGAIKKSTSVTLFEDNRACMSRRIPLLSPRHQITSICSITSSRRRLLLGWFKLFTDRLPSCWLMLLLRACLEIYTRMFSEHLALLMSRRRVGILDMRKGALFIRIWSHWHRRNQCAWNPTTWWWGCQHGLTHGVHTYRAMRYVRRTQGKSGAFVWLNKSPSPKICSCSNHVA